MAVFKIEVYNYDGVYDWIHAYKSDDKLKRLNKEAEEKQDWEELDEYQDELIAKYFIRLPDEKGRDALFKLKYKGGK